MRRHWSLRALAVVFAAWFGIAGLGPMPFVQCSMPQMDMGTPGGSMASHDASMQQTPRDQQRHPMPDQQSHRCCMMCCCQSLSAAPPRPVEVAAAAPAVPVRATTVRGDRITSPKFLLPFATAPPRPVA